MKMRFSRPAEFPSSPRFQPDRKILAEIIRRVDGVMLTGGDDINPDLYAKNLPRAVRKTVETTPDGGGRDLLRTDFDW